jgi:Reverse transcriptase (RNA-dependent DNA polymerase)
MEPDQRSCVVQPSLWVNRQREEPVNKAKPFDIPKREVWKAFKHVKANQGAAGVDGQSIADFEADLTNNLYKLWNRLSSGSYFPPPVRRVEIPKANGGTRPLGIPTVADRIAQEVARRFLEPCLEPVFHADSYGYRPGRSALDAVRTARRRCWRYDWVLDKCSRFLSAELILGKTTPHLQTTTPVETNYDDRPIARTASTEVSWRGLTARSGYSVAVDSNNVK